MTGIVYCDGDSILNIKFYIKCPLKIKKRAYTRDAMYH